MKTHLNPGAKGKLLIALAMAMFAFIGPLLRISSLSNYALLFYSGLIGWIGLLAYFFLSKKISVILPVKEFRLQLLLGILASINLITYFEAFKRTSIANAVFPHYLAPIIAALFAPLLLKERLEKRTLAALLLSVAGLFLIV
ncbi:DMT family transporter, partial [Candidatus Woesearchaeota archaeon]|nr:DMT family transporter [Candidatus Woesearchaeota archaeon]